VLRSSFPALVDVGRLHYAYPPVRTLLRDRFLAAGGIVRETEAFTSHREQE
jgi:hypothetical protein